MDVLRAVILGLVQGITEFLPISSDGHLVVVDTFLPGGLAGRDALGFDILLHSGSLIAILVGFRDVWSKLLRGIIARDRVALRMAGLLIIATVPGVIAGLLLQDIVAGDLRTLTAAAIGFLVTAACLVVGETIGRLRGERSSFSFIGALLVGLAQAVAILPGVSRSGLTVSMGRALGMKREDALNFSFLMALPIIGGAVAKTGVDALQGSVVFPDLLPSFAGFATSLVVSLGAIVFLRRFVRSYSFAWFAWYLIPLALLLIGEDFGLRTFFTQENVALEVRSIGAVAVFFFALIEVVPPFSFVSPGIIALVIAGSLAPDLPSIGIFALSAACASFVGNTALYVAGRVAGAPLTRALRIKDDTRANAENIIRRAGLWAVVVGQFIGPLRPTVSFVAAILGMHPAKFFTAALIGAVLWGSAGVGVGYIFKNNAALAAFVVAATGTIIMIIVGVLAVIQLRRRHRTNVR